MQQRKIFSIKRESAYNRLKLPYITVGWMRRLDVDTRFTIVTLIIVVRLGLLISINVKIMATI